MSIIRGPLFKFALVFVSFTSLIELAHARVDFSSNSFVSVDQDSLELRARIAREWNERIPAGFWEQASQAQKSLDPSPTQVSLDVLGRELSQLQFQYHSDHLAALRANSVDVLPQSSQIVSMGRQEGFGPQPASVLVFDLQDEFRKLGFQPVSGSSSQPTDAPTLDVNSQSMEIVVAEGSSSSPLVSEDQSVDRVFVEAFDRFYSPLQGVETEMLSNEGSLETPLGWQIAHHLNHWSTLHWLDSGNRTDQVPLIGRNTMALLESRFGIRSEPSAGMIFGRIKAGWKVELSDRAERPIFMDDSGVLSEQDHVDSDRSFILMNAAPGVQVVFAQSIGDQGNAAVAIPVMTGVATYVDLTHLQQVSVSGQVSEKTDDASVWTTLRVVGQDRAVTSFQLGQRFKLDQVVLAFPYPLYVETDRGEGYTQRYRLLPEQLNDARLTRFSGERVEKWRSRISQLQSGINPQSGMLVAAFPGLSQQYSESELKVRIRSISGSTDLTPQIYVRAPNGVLNLDDTIAPHEDFIVGAQIPEGPFLLETLDLQGRLIHSELGFASPGVLNIFNPK